VDLQSIATEARNNKSSRPPILQIIGIIIFILPILGHGFKWGWIYPVITLFTLGFMIESLGVFGVILWVLLMGGSVWLCRRRVLTMRARRRWETTENTAKLYSSTILRDDD